MRKLYFQFFALVLFSAILETALFAGTIPLGTAANISGGRTKIYDVSTQDLVTWSPSMIILSSDASAVTWEIFIDQSINNLNNTSTVTLTTQTTGGTIYRNQKAYVRVTAVDANGESIATPGNKFTTTGSTTDTNQVSASWTAISGATSYNVYASNEPGNETYYGNTASTSLVITNLSVDNPKGLPVIPIVNVTNAAGNNVVIHLSDLVISERIQVFTVTSAGTKAIVNIPVTETLNP
jgi:hypothetical protein